MSAAAPSMRFFNSVAHLPRRQQRIHPLSAKLWLARSTDSFHPRPPFNGPQFIKRAAHSDTRTGGASELSYKELRQEDALNWLAGCRNPAKVVDR